MKNYIKNGFDYKLQVWVENYIIFDCGHSKNQLNCCNARKLKGKDIRKLNEKINV